MERVCNNNYVVDICDTNCLVNTTSNGKQFSFSGYNIDYSVCYELKSLEWNRRSTLVLSNTRELDRDLFTN